MRFKQFLIETTKSEREIINLAGKLERDIIDYLYSFKKIIFKEPKDNWFFKRKTKQPHFKSTNKKNYDYDPSDPSDPSDEEYQDYMELHMTYPFKYLNKDYKIEFDNDEFNHGGSYDPYINTIKINVFNYMIEGCGIEEKFLNKEEISREEIECLMNKCNTKYWIAHELQHISDEVRSKNLYKNVKQKEYLNLPYETNCRYVQTVGLLDKNKYESFNDYLNDFKKSYNWYWDELSDKIKKRLTNRLYKDFTYDEIEKV